MANHTFWTRAGSVQGVKHVQLGTNNQDAFGVLEFGVPKWKRTFRIGIVSDGCSGIPAFTHSEVGAWLLVTFCTLHVQQMVLGGTRLEDIPPSLYHLVTNYLDNVTALTIPHGAHWPYPINFKGSHAFRNDLTAQERFKTDYLAATIIGFVDDGDTLVTFRAGDGTIIVNDDVLITDQNDTPDYPHRGGEFEVKTYASQEVVRLDLCTDGIEELLNVGAAGLPDRLLTHMPDNPSGLQFCLNILKRDYPRYVSDDLTVVTRELRKEEP